MPKFPWWEWILLIAVSLVVAIAAPVSDYRQPLFSDARYAGFAAECLRSLPIFLVLLWATSRVAGFVRRHQWRSAAGCLSIAVAAVMLFFAGQAVGDYIEVHWAAHSMASQVDENDRHVAARAIYSDAGRLRYVVFDPADTDMPLVEQTISNTQNLCIDHLRSIGDRFYLVSGVEKPCR